MSMSIRGCFSELASMGLNRPNIEAFNGVAHDNNGGITSHTTIGITASNDATHETTFGMPMGQP